MTQLAKPWTVLERDTVADLSGQLGVFEIANAVEEVHYIGFAGGRSLFGLRSELFEWLDRGKFFRFEVTTAYYTRHRELLMAHYLKHGRYPIDNPDSETVGLGRLS